MAAKKFLTGPRMILAAVVLVLAVALFFALRTPAVEVDVAQVTRGPMATTVDDLAETRERDLFMVSAPITGELLRVPLKPGARVVAGETLLARIRPVGPAAIDARMLAQVEANVRTLGAQADAAEAQVAQARAARELADRQYARVAALRQRGFAAQAALDEAQAGRDRAVAALRAAGEAERAARSAVVAARAGLIVDRDAPSRGTVDVRAPVSGYVLTVPQESERVVAAGTALVAVGDPARLELVTDLLSADAVQVRPGAAVSIEDWGGDRPLQGRVRLIEPYGFLKISALGVEEQRVNVVMDFAEPRERWARLGHGFRATVRITTWAVADAVRVPVGAIFRSGSGWQLFRVEAGRAHAVPVRLGRINQDWAQVLGGVRPGDAVIVHPAETVREGVRVTGRAAR